MLLVSKVGNGGISYSWGRYRGHLPVPGIFVMKHGEKVSNCGIVNLTIAFHLCLEMASVSSICSIPLLIIPHMIPGWKLKTRNKKNFNGVSINSVLKSPCSRWSFSGHIWPSLKGRKMQAAINFNIL